MTLKVVVTGHAGFIGANLTNLLLSENYEVIGLDKFKTNNKNIQEYVIDFSTESIENYLDPETFVVHLGAISNDKEAKINPLNTLNINIIGTQKIIESCKKMKVKKFIFASSEWVYPETTLAVEQTELDILTFSNLTSYYALTKLMSEQFIKVSELSHYNILRFGIVYGPRKIPGSSPEDIARKVKNGESIEVGSSNTARRFIYIDDLIDGIVKSLKSEINKEILNLSGNELLSLRDIAEICASITGKKLDFLDLARQPSIRNPVNFKAIEYLNWKPSTRINVGLEKCILKMEGLNGL